MVLPRTRKNRCSSRGTMNNNKAAIINALLGDGEPLFLPDDAVPAFLIPKYRRQSALLELIPLLTTRPFDEDLIGIVVRVALKDEEEEIRIKALEALVGVDSRVAMIVAAASTYDSDPVVRERALEILDALNCECIVDMATRLMRDSSKLTAATAARILQERHKA
jgi:hypothetical protein